MSSRQFLLTLSPIADSTSDDKIIDFLFDVISKVDPLVHGAIPKGLEGAKLKITRSEPISAVAKAAMAKR